MLSLVALWWALGCGSDGSLTGTVRGVNCWDLDADGAADAEEDANGDGAHDALDCRGADGADGADGGAGQAGESGPPGAAGRDGLSCWDTDGDGLGDPEEDVDADGAWTARDCRGADAGGGVEKGAIYAVTGASGSTSTAACADNDDVMLTGGCAFRESCIPAHFTGEPRYNDDDSRPAEWYCQLNCGSVTASGFCLDVGG